jgi:hypothetical protein
MIKAMDVDTVLHRLATKARQKHPDDRLRAAMRFHDLVERHERQVELDARMLQMLPKDWERLFAGELLRDTEPEGNA